MTHLRWLLALPAIFLATSGPSMAAEVRDKAGLFSADAVTKAQSELERVERDYGVPIRIETVDSLNGSGIDDVLKQHARAIDAKGIYVLIARKERKTEAGESSGYAKYLPRSKTIAIREAFNSEFGEGRFDAGLFKGVEKIESTLSQAQVENGGPLRPTAPVVRRAAQGAAPAGRVPVAARGQAGQNSWGIGSLLTIVIGILAIFLVIRILGALFSAGRGGYANQGRMGGPGGYGPGGPGYGAPGYGGGGGGGFMSSMFGGIGGALAGNWLYDQFSGRHHDSGSVSQSSYDPGVGGVETPANDDFVTPGDGGGDWGGGGGGGDWGGGGGGGGDWGGGGGGDWGGGGGGDDGGSW